jgi:hypothetical protein
MLIEQFAANQPHFHPICAALAIAKQGDQTKISEVLQRRMKR